MIVGIGVDSIEHERVRDAITSPAFAARVFTPEELELPLTSISARWAAREAAVKALGGLHGMQLRDLAVTRTHLGRPVFVQSPELDRVLARLGVNELHLSLTHDQTTSCAFVVAERH